jgi:hypothetical protein
VDPASLATLAIVGTLLPILAIGELRAYRIARVRAEAARVLGLRIEPRGWLTFGRIIGTHAGLTVELRDVFVALTREEVVSVELPVCVPRDFSLGVELLAGRDIETGDPVFDGAIFVGGIPASALAILDARTREMVRRLIVPGGFSLRQGRLIRERSVPTTQAEQVTGVIRDATAVGRALAQGAEEPAHLRLARNAREDPIEAVRSRCLQALCESFPDTPLCEATCRGALSDRSPAIRLAAARALGAKGVDGLEDLIRHRGCPDAVAKGALESLLALKPGRDVVLPHLLALLDSGQVSARRLAVETLGRMRHVPAVDRLVALVGEADVETAAAAAHAVGHLGSAGVVPHLRAAAEQRRQDVAVGEAVVEAVRAIQARLTDADAGQLSLPEAEDPAGALSLADATQDERGRLSLRREPPAGEKGA